MFPLDVLGEPVWQRLTWTLLHFLWQGLAVAAVVATVLYVWPVRRAHNRYLICLSALVAMAACPLVTFMVIEVPESATVASREAEIEAPVPPAAEPELELVASEIRIGSTGPAARESQPPLEPSETAASEMGDPASLPVPVTWEAELRQYVDAIQPYAMIAWIAGVLLLAVRLSLSWFRVRWLAWGRRVIPADLAVKAATLGGRLGLRFPPRVCVSEKIREAIVVGLWRPLVLLPASWLTEMTPEVLEAVIAHELAHVRRLDLWVNLLQRLMETLLFYHPAVWWLSRRVGLEREMCADELAVGATSERLVYATALEQLGRMRLGQTAPQFGAGMGGNRMVLLNRVGNILGLSASDKRARWWPVGLLALAVPSAIWLASTSIVSPTENETRAEEVFDDMADTSPSKNVVGETEQTRVVSNQVKIEIASNPGNKEVENKNVAWGEAVNGLQAGLATSFDHVRPYQPGQNVPLKFLLRNTTNKPITLTSARVPVFINWDNYRRPPGPQLFGPDGKQVFPAPGVGGRGLPGTLTRTIAPGEVVTLTTSRLPLRPENWEGTTVNLLTYRVKPGKHRVSLSHKFDDQGGKHWGGTVTTGMLDLHVHPNDKPLSIPGNAWGKEQDGVRCRLHTDKARLRLGEPPILLVDLQNQGQRTIEQIWHGLEFTLEVDGKWTGKFSPTAQNNGQVGLTPGQEWINVPLALQDSHYNMATTSSTPGGPATFSQLLGPGRHTIRVDIDGVVSNPVEIEIAGRQASDHRDSKQLTVDLIRAAGNLRETPSFWIGYEQLNEETLRERATRLIEASPGLEVVVRVDRAMPHEHVVELLELLNAVGAKNVSLAVFPLGSVFAIHPGPGRDGTIRGKVTAPNSRGRPANYVVMLDHEAWTNRRGELPNMEVSAGETFEFRNVPAGKCKVRARPAVASGQNAGLAAKIAEVEVMVKNKQVVEIEISFDQSQPSSARGKPAAGKSDKPAAAPKPPRASIAGRVTDAGGKPMAGALIEWGRCDDPPSKRQRTTADAEGRYRLEVTDFGVGFRLGVSAPGMAPTWQVPYASWVHPPEPVRDEDAIPPKRMDFQLEPMHWIAGTVVDQSGKPIEGVRIGARTAVEGFTSSFSSPSPPMLIPGDGRYEIGTDAAGRFRLAGLPAKHVRLDLAAAHRHVNDRNYPVDQEHRIVMSGSGRPGTIRARVVDGRTGKPVEQFNVARRYDPRQREIKSADGRFPWDDMHTEGNSYAFYIYSRDYAPAKVDVQAVRPGSQEETVIKLSPGNPLLAALVDAQSGKPLVGVPVLYAVVGDNGRYFEWSDRDSYIDGHHRLTLVQRAVTGDDGGCWFSEAHDTRKGTLFVITPGYERIIFRPEDRPTPSDSKRVQISLHREGSITGVLVRDGRPEPNVNVSIWKGKPQGQLEESFETAVTDSQGRYRFGRLGPGTYRLAYEVRVSRTVSTSKPFATATLARGEQKVIEPVAEGEGGKLTGAEKPVAKGIEFLAKIPEFRELNLKMTQPRLREIIHSYSVAATCVDLDDSRVYHLYTTEGENVLVTFRDGECAGIQRMRPDRDMATKLYASHNENLQKSTALYFKTCEFLCQQQGDRVEAAQRFAKAAQLASASETGVRAHEIADLLEKMAKEPRPEGEKLPAGVFELSGDISLTEELENLFFDVRDLSYMAGLVPGKCRVLGEAVISLNKGQGNPALRIRDLAKDSARRELIIPRLLRMLDDRRPTRSWAGAMNGGHVLRYCDVALEILADVAGMKKPNNQTTHFDPRTTRDAYLGTADAKTHKEIIARVHAWWAKEQASPGRHRWARM